MLVKIDGKDTETVINALIGHAGKLPDELYKSLTWDRGKEMADHKRFTVATDIKVYFCGVSRTQAVACDAVSKMGEGLPRVSAYGKRRISGCSSALIGRVAVDVGELKDALLDYGVARAEGMRDADLYGEDAEGWPVCMLGDPSSGRFSLHPPAQSRRNRSLRTSKSRSVLSWIRYSKNS
jgi:hypothetical protein